MLVYVFNSSTHEAVHVDFCEFEDNLVGTVSFKPVGLHCGILSQNTKRKLETDAIFLSFYLC